MVISYITECELISTLNNFIYFVFYRLILNRSHGLYYDSVKSGISLSEKK